MEKIFVILWILFALYILVLLMVAADLWSGLRKAKKNNIVRSSYGFKRTVEKIGRYYNALFALTIIDAMQLSAIWYLEKFYGYNIPFFPFITLLGAIGLAMIELKSIYEKAEDKQRFHEAGAMLLTAAKNKSDIEEIAKSVGEYLNKNNIKNDEKTTINSN